MNKEFKISFISFLVVLGLVAIFYAPITVRAAVDATGTWGTVDWKFEASTGTVTFISEGEVPATRYPDNRPWFNTLSTDTGQAIKKIVFEKTVVLPADSSALFSGMGNLEEMVGFDKLDLSNVRTMNGTFVSCKSITNVDNLASWDVSKVTSTKNMFNSCDSLENIAGLANWEMGNVTNISTMFTQTKIKNANSLADWNVSNVTEMNGAFSNCQSLENIDALANWNTGKVTDMSTMFYNTIIKNTDSLTDWDINNVTTMQSMFHSCAYLESADLRNWITEDTINVIGMFTNCENLNRVDFSSWNTSSTTPSDFNSMLYGCNKLKSITLGKNTLLHTNVKLSAIDTATGEYTGEWIGVDTGEIYSSSDDFMESFDGSKPDTYIWRVIPHVEPTKYNTGYVFESGTNGKALPKAVIDLLPSDSAEYEDGVAATAINPVQTEVIASGGTWIFQGWDENEKTINGDHVIFTGTWTFEATEPEASTYHAGYTFVSGTNGRSLPSAILALLPDDSAGYTDGNTVTAIAPAQTEVTASGGT